MTYLHDLRIKALDYIEKDGSQVEASRIFGVTPRTLFHWMKRKNQGCLAPSKRRRSPYKIEEEKLRAYMKEHPDDYLREIGESIGAVFYVCKRLKITLKKRHRSTKKGMKQKEKSSRRKESICG